MSQDDPSKTEATQQPAPASSHATRKYQQVVVPDHALKPDTSGTSFLRTGTFPSLTDTTKQPPGFQKSLELARLAGEHHLKTGGSWHHVDGNRIETTTGRKVEVIAGSYIAHRGPGNSPGPNFSATWATQSYTQVGSKDLPVGGVPGGTTAPDPQSDFADTLSVPFSNSLVFNPPPPGSTPDVNTAAPGSGQLQSGDVASTTWAQRVLTYVGSVNQPVPLVYAETHAGTYHSYSYYSNESLTYVGSSDNPVPTVYAETHGASIVTKNRAENVVQDTTSLAITTTQEAAGAITVTNMAALFTTANLCAAIASVNVGGAIATVNVAPAILALNIGANWQINIPDKWTFSGSETGVSVSSLDMNTVKKRVDAIRENMATAVSDLIIISSHVATSYTDLVQQRTSLGTVSAVLHGMQNLGS